MEEIWKDVPEYEGLYQVSSFGRIKSLGRLCASKCDSTRFVTERVLKPSVDGGGYESVELRSLLNNKRIKIHKLVAMAFLGHVPCKMEFVINHIDGDKRNNNLENIEIVTQRQNSTICFRRDIDSFSSKYVGVSRNNKLKKWKASIMFNNNAYHLGLFDTEIEASNEYQKALRHINNDTFYQCMTLINRKISSNYRGVSWKPASNKWESRITINGKTTNLGSFLEEKDASDSYQKALEKHVMQHV